MATANWPLHATNDFVLDGLRRIEIEVISSIACVQETV